MPPDQFGNQLADEDHRFPRRRKFPRYSVRWPVEIFEPINQKKLIAETADASLKGCYVLTQAHIERDFIVQLTIRRQKETLQVWTRVVHNFADQGMGLAFLSTQLAQEGLLTRWFSEDNAIEKSSS